ncbi:hypothetical protein [Neptuniibacter sp.]
MKTDYKSFTVMLVDEDTVTLDKLYSLINELGLMWFVMLHPYRHWNS